MFSYRCNLFWDFVELIGKRFPVGTVLVGSPVGTVDVD